MKRTHFLTAAYAVCMEMLVLLLVLTSLDKNSDLSEKLRSALSFYRENRELITMFANTVNAAPAAANASAEESAPSQQGAEQKESRPQGGIDSMKILEEYLKRSAV